MASIQICGEREREKVLGLTPLTPNDQQGTGAESERRKRKEEKERDGKGQTQYGILHNTERSSAREVSVLQQPPSSLLL